MSLLRALGLIVVLLSAPLMAQSPATGPLQAEVNAIAAAHHGKVALYAENLATQETVGIDPDAEVQTASVIKLAILYEALEQVRAGQAHFEDRLTLRPEDRVPGSGVLHFFDAPLPLTFKDVLTMMVVMSDNTATNLAIDHLGLAKIDARVAALGLRHTYLYKKVFTKLEPGQVLPDDFKRFGLGKTTAREITALMGKIAGCELGGPVQPGDAALCSVALTMLHNQFYRTAIPRYLDALPGAASDSIANKTGALDAVRVDVAAVSTKSGMVLISAFTYENRDRSWGSDHEGDLTIAKLARAIVARWSPNGLAAWPSQKFIDKVNVP